MWLLAGITSSRPGSLPWRACRAAARWRLRTYCSSTRSASCWSRHTGSSSRSVASGSTFFISAIRLAVHSDWRTSHSEWPQATSSRGRRSAPCRPYGGHAIRKWPGRPDPFVHLTGARTGRELWNVIRTYKRAVAGPGDVGRYISCSAVLSDLDGVLIDSRRSIERTWTAWARRRQLSPSEVLRVVHGRRTLETLAEVAPHLRADVELAELARLETGRS